VNKSASGLKVQTYSSKSVSRRIDRLAITIVKDLPKALLLGWSLALRDIKAKYRQTALGLVWPVLYPLAYSAIFVALLEAKGISGDIGGVPAGAYIFCGLAIFQVWIEELKGQLEILRKNKDVASKLVVPPETFFYASFFQSMFNLMIRVVLIFLAFLVFGIDLGFATSCLFVFFAAFCVFSASVIGFVLQPFSVLYRDVAQTINSLTMGLLLLSAIFYAPTTDIESVLFTVNSYNPLAVFVNTGRDFLVGGEHVLLGAAMVWMPVLIGVFMLQLLMLRVVYPIVIERMGS